MSAPWLSLIGIGEDGRDGLSPRARAALDGARTVVGGGRHLALAGPLSCRTVTWPSPIEDVVPQLLALRGTPVAVLATGDPFHYGVGTMLSRHVASDELITFPQPSAFSLAASRLGWSLQDVALVSLHGRDEGNLVRHLADRARILILSWDGATPALVAAMLRERGYAASRLVMLERMGGPHERLRETRADPFDLDGIHPLNTIALECISSGEDIGTSLSILPDGAFEHDGQITKQAVRAVTLTALAPRAGDLLWDIGAGSGSVCIEWLRANPRNRAIAIERRPDRVARISGNAARHGVVPRVVTGEAPHVFDDLAAPDAIFVGGGVADDRLLQAACDALRPGGRLVANAVTLEAQAHLTRRYESAGGDLTLLQHAQAAPVGRFTGWRPAMPIVQWRWVKPR